MTKTDWNGPPFHPEARLDDIPQEARDRFLARLPEGPADECWMWTTRRGDTPDTYSNFTWRDDAGVLHRIKCHRLSWMLAHQADIPKGRLILHCCDRPGCVNPSHLRVGNHRDNQNDAIARGRWRYSPPSVPRVLSCIRAKPGTYSRGGA